LPPGDYFRLKKFKSLPRKRVDELIKVAKKLESANNIPITAFSNLWSSNNGPVPQAPSNDIFSRFNSLYNTKLRIQTGHAVLDCAGRFNSLFIRHAVDVLTSNKELAQTAAFERIAKETLWSFEKIKSEYEKARNFITILELDGPGYLLRLGSEVNSL
jgi:hypothetical protein